MNTRSDKITDKFWVLYAALACLSALVILIVCWTPANRLPASEHHPRIPNIDKLVHFGVFAVFGFFCKMADTKGRRTILVIGLGVLLAIVSELGQGTSFVGRDPTIGDGVADIAGAIAGILIAHQWRARTHSAIPKS